MLVWNIPTIYLPDAIYTPVESGSIVVLPLLLCVIATLNPPGALTVGLIQYVERSLRS